jgi:hypothetical protein
MLVVFGDGTAGLNASTAGWTGPPWSATSTRSSGHRPPSSLGPHLPRPTGHLAARQRAARRHRRCLLRVRRLRRGVHHVHAEHRRLHERPGQGAALLARCVRPARLPARAPACQGDHRSDPRVDRQPPLPPRTDRGDARGEPRVIAFVDAMTAPTVSDDDKRAAFHTAAKAHVRRGSVRRAMPGAAAPLGAAVDPAPPWWAGPAPSRWCYPVSSSPRSQLPSSPSTASATTSCSGSRPAARRRRRRSSPVLYLASDEASYVNGTSLVVDGAWDITNYPRLAPYV